MALPDKPITRTEQYLSNIAGEQTDLPEYPITREEQYLAYIAENGGGGGGGTTNYNSLTNKPKINNVELSGNKTTHDLGLDNPMVGATASDDGAAGLVPKPMAGDENKFLTGSGAWKEASGGSAELSDDLTAAVTVGGITAGDQYTQGTSLETVIRDMLEPTLYPTFTAPSASMTATGAKLLEIGATLATTMTVTFNRGSINPAYGTDGYRAGAATGYHMNGGESQVSNTFSITVSESQKTYQVTVDYAAGQQPKDSKGQNYNQPYAAGSMNTNTITYEFVDAIWSNAANINVVAKEALVSKSAKTKTFNFPAQTLTEVETFDIPASWTVTKVEMLNDLSGKYESVIGEFDTSSVSHNDAAGNPVSYTRYEDNRGYVASGRTIKVTWS